MPSLSTTAVRSFRRSSMPGWRGGRKGGPLRGWCRGKVAMTWCWQSGSGPIFQTERRRHGQARHADRNRASVALAPSSQVRLFPPVPHSRMIAILKLADNLLACLQRRRVPAIIRRSGRCERRGLDRRLSGSGPSPSSPVFRQAPQSAGSGQSRCRCASSSQAADGQRQHSRDR